LSVNIAMLAVGIWH